MTRAATLPAFTDSERVRVHTLLAACVAFMMGRKFEEYDWTETYCRAKHIPVQGWSNLNIDVMYKGLGVEHKMVCYRSKPSLREACGSTIMHPAATRSIRVPALETDPQDAMREVLGQYAGLIDERRAKVRETAAGARPDMRTGWLLWQESLREFLYFEEEMVKPRPSEYYAEWATRVARGARKGSTSLWIYERGTGRKRYSVTTSAGAKIQPYFDVPPPNDPNLYLFTVQGEVIIPGQVRIWVTEATARELQKILGSLDTEAISSAIAQAAVGFNPDATAETPVSRSAEPIVIQATAYAALQGMFPRAVSDEHLMQLLLHYLRAA